MKRVVSIWLMVLILSSGLPSGAISAAETNRPQSAVQYLHLHTGKVNPVDLMATSEALPLAPGKSGLFVVQFTDVINDASHALMKEVGVKVGPYLPDFAFIIQATAEQVQRLAKDDSIRAVIRYRSEWKVSPQVAEARGLVNLQLQAFPGSGLQPAAMMERSRALGATMVEGGLVLSQVTPAAALDLATDESVLFIEVEKPIKLFNQQARGVMTVDTVGGPWLNGLTGNGQIVAVADTGLDTGNAATLHPDLRSRLLTAFPIGRASAWSDLHGHGTHVAGSVLGTGASSSGAHAGVAPGARLVFQSLADEAGGLSLPGGGMSALFNQARLAGATIHSNSWGVPYAYGGWAYDSLAAQTDQYLWSMRNFTVLFAAGNDGDYGLDTISTPSTAKNVISVGASENNRPDKGSYADSVNQVAGFSSRGNTPDGRVKPDLVAPGTWILSTRSSMTADNGWSPYDENYVWMGGTSMATPLTAGASALVREYLQKKGFKSPASSLMKAALINGAQDMGYGWMSPNQGWGRVDLSNTLYPTGGRQVNYVNEGTALATGSSRTHTYDMQAGDILKITLVWTDYPSASVAAKNLVNDLDLMVTGPGSHVYKGNCFDDSRTTASTACATYDRTNNVENVYIAAPTAGRYTVKVSGYNVPSGPQPYALVVSGRPIDTQAPTVQLTNPKVGTTLRGTLSLTAKAQDNIGVSRVEFLHGTTLLGADTDGSDGWSLAWDTTAAESGSYALQAKAYDHSGNQATSSAVSVKVDNLGPILTITSPSGGAVVGRTVVVKASATDMAGVQKVEFLVDDTLMYTDTYSPYSWSWNTTTGGDGPYTLKARGWDKVGNTMEVTTAVIVDNTLPTVALGLSDGATLPAGNTPLTATASDANGVSRVEFLVGTTKVGTDSDGSDGWSVNWNTALLSSGSYQVRAVAYDAAGNSQAATIKVAIDTRLPVVTITSPAMNAKLNGSVTVSGRATDNLGITKVEIYLGGVLSETQTPPTPTTSFNYLWNWATSGEGERSLSVVAYDAAGNQTASAVTVYLDQTPPTVSITSPGDGGYAGRTTTVTADAADNAQVARVEFYLNGTLVSTDSAAPFSWNWSTSNLPVGSAHTLQAKAYDTAGLSTLSSPVAVTVDNAGPTALSLSLTPAPVGSIVRGSVTIDAVVGESDGVTRVEFYRDGLSIGSDTAAPFKLEWDTTTAPNGTRKITATAFDAAGNSRSISLSVMVDNASPVLSVARLADGGEYRGTISASLTLSDNLKLGQVLVYLDSDPSTPLLVRTLGGMRSSQTLSIPTATSPDGLHTLHFRLTDAAGNSTETTYSVRFDNEVPAVALTGPSAGAKLSTGPTEITATASDNSTVARVDFYTGSAKVGTDTDGSDGWRATWNITNRTRSGSYTLKAVAFDSAGNSSTSTMSVLVDSVLPVVTFVRPVSGAVIGGPTVGISASAKDSGGLIRLEVLVDDTTLDVLIFDTPVTAYAYTGTWPTDAFATGPRVVKVRATDAYGNIGEKAITVALDKEAPVVDIVSPGGGYAAVVATVSTNITDLGAGARKIEIFVDGVVKYTTSIKPSLSYTHTWKWYTRGLASGTDHTVMVQVTDAAGNVAADSVTVTVDPQAPVATIVSPLTGYVRGTQTVQVSATDNVGLAKADIYLGSTLLTSLSDLGGLSETFTYSWDTTDVSDGSYTLKVIVHDLAGATVTKSVSVRVDNTAPTLSLTAPADGAVVKGTIPIRASATDRLGVDRVEFYVDGALMSTDKVSSYYWNWDTRLVANGTYTVAAIAFDRAGNQIMRTVTVTVNN